MNFNSLKNYATKSIDAAKPYVSRICDTKLTDAERVVLKTTACMTVFTLLAGPVGAAGVVLGTMAIARATKE
jgi:hypothetical protein